MPLGQAFVVIVTLLSEGALLVVAAQAGFIDGPRVLANMAVDSWMPRRFAALSERLTTQNGILLMGAASLAALLYTRGDVGQLVVMYSINVFLTFSLSMFGCCGGALEPNPSLPTAAILVAGYGGLGLHTFLALFRQFPITQGGGLHLGRRHRLLRIQGRGHGRGAGEERRGQPEEVRSTSRARASRRRRAWRSGPTRSRRARSSA